ncbi:MAG: ABC transporter substrate-binding protein, partial [Pseudomonadota bacterium]
MNKFVFQHICCALLLFCIGLSKVFAQVAGVEKPLVQEQLDKVKVQLKWHHQFQFAGYYAALEQGFYRDAGLDVKLIEHSPGVTPIEQLLQGFVDFAVADTGALIYRSTGVPLVALAAIFQHSPSILLARSDSGINEVTDLRHRRVMVSGGYMNAELIAMLQNAGLSPEETNLVPSETSLDALLEKRVDAYNAYTTNEPFFMQEKGIGYNIFQPRHYDVDFYGDTLFTTEQKIAEQPALVERFRRATLKGWQYAVEYPEEIVELILAKYNTQNKMREHLMFEAAQSINLILPSVVPIGYMNEERWRRIESVFIKQGRISHSIDLSDFIYPTDELGQLLKILDRHRVLLASIGIGFIGLLLALHIVSLRLQIRARTRELEEAKLRAEAEARTDVLTGLPNRRSFFEVFARDVSLAARKNMPVTLIAADIDYFKRVNDKFGHAAGDEVLHSEPGPRARLLSRRDATLAKPADARLWLHRKRVA